ncbi:PAS domain-containing protein [Desulfovibrio sp. JC022]|uniref:PAS domain-containing protein n=1 Tax=Desulfovibrio sp. JC022 TaxID=2593642 RepID=UPI0013D3FD29|nr:PAS domain-containing protein [Desulfovibrio sp. JC022]NDV24289.1 PAS domain S-box protein [Desulfovibrio sp. JC022]
MTFEELLAITAKPVIVADINGIITAINAPFTIEFGWTESGLVGKSLTTIIPSALRDAHQLGFSAYASTGHASLLGQHLDLEIVKEDGSVVLADHYILSGTVNGRKTFAAQITSRQEG